jgi:hypothetical protein
MASKIAASSLAGVDKQLVRPVLGAFPTTYSRSRILVSDSLALVAVREKSARSFVESFRGCVFVCVELF